jgi:hypothetical protein
LRGRGIAGGMVMHQNDCAYGRSFAHLKLGCEVRFGSTARMCEEWGGR